LDDAHLDVDGTHDDTDGPELGGVPGGSDEAEGSGDHDGVGCAEFVGEGSGEKTAKGRHADEGHGAVAHDATALVFGYEGVDDGVAGGEALHHAEAYDEHEKVASGSDAGNDLVAAKKIGVRVLILRTGFSDFCIKIPAQEL
jgi:hypothetical protein